MDEQLRVAYRLSLCLTLRLLAQVTILHSQFWPL